jgi:hypothetical protein
LVVEVAAALVTMVVQAVLEVVVALEDSVLEQGYRLLPELLIPSP